MRVFAICPRCGRRVVFSPSPEVLLDLKTSGIASVSFDHIDHVLVVYFDRQGRARGTEVHRFISRSKSSSFNKSSQHDKTPIETLGLEKDIVNKFVKQGFVFVEDIVWFHPARLREILGLSLEESINIIEKALNFLEKKSREGLFFRSSELTELESRKRFLHSGSSSLDKILSGGFASGEITELVGEYRTGKSQICYTALATVFLPPDKGGLNDGDISALIIDSERTFNVERIKHIFNRFSLRHRLLDRILVGRPANSYHMLKMIRKLSKTVKEENVRLIVVDSLTKLPRIDFKGRRELYDRQRIIHEMIESLRRLAISYKIPVIITNQVTAEISDSESVYSSGKPIGGHILAHSVDTRLYLEYVNKHTRRVKIIDSSWLPPGETLIKIDTDGISDIEGDTE